MGEGPECHDVRLIGGQLRQRQAGDRLHISKSMKLSNPCQGPSGGGGTSERKSPVAPPAPSNCATMNAGASAGRIPANVSVAERASVTAGVANDVDAGNQEAAVMYEIGK